MVRSILNIRIAAVGLLTLVAVLTACSGGEADDESNAGPVVNFASPSGDVTAPPRRSPVVTPVPTPTPLNICAPNPDPASPALLQVVSPVSEERVKIPFHVRGWGSNIGFESRGVALAIVNGKQEVTQVFRLPPQPREYRIAPPGMTVTEFTQPFAADLVINGLKEPTAFCLWIYLETDAAAKPKGVIQIPIVATP